MTDFRVWMKDAACAGTFADALFFPDRENKDTAARAQQEYCTTCPVRDACLKFAVVNDLAGVWGGTTQRQRHSLPEIIVTLFRTELSPLRNLEEVLVVHTVEVSLEEWEEPEQEPPVELLDPTVPPLAC